jgi:hypothetical protein
LAATWLSCGPLKLTILAGLKASTMTPERKAQLEAELDAILGPPPLPKPKVVVSDGVVVRDADVQVSPADRRNSQHGRVEIVRVRRADCVTINMAEAERQWWLIDQDQAEKRQRSRQLDPHKLGLWGPIE